MTRLSRPMFIGVTEAALLLSVSPRTVKRYIQDGHLDAGELPHGQVRISRAQVIGLVRTSTTRTP